MERNPSRRNFIGSRYRVIKQIAEQGGADACAAEAAPAAEEAAEAPAAE